MWSQAPRYHTVMRSFLQYLALSAWGDIHRLVTLASCVVGSSLTEKAGFVGWGGCTDSQAAQAASQARRFARWLDNCSG
jgi:hypothetical protein